MVKNDKYLAALPQGKKNFPVIRRYLTRTKSPDTFLLLPSTPFVYSSAFI